MEPTMSMYNFHIKKLERTWISNELTVNYLA